MISSAVLSSATRKIATSAARRFSRVLILAACLACSRSSRSLSAVSTASVNVSPVSAASSLASRSASSLLILSAMEEV